MQNYVPEGYPAFIPYLAVHDAARAIDFYEKAFGAKQLERYRLVTADGRLAYAELQIGDVVLMLSDDFFEPSVAVKELHSRCRSPHSLGGTTIMLHLYVSDVDAVFQRAVAAGAQVEMAPMDASWGDRFCKLMDPFGHCWSLGTHTRQIPDEEVRSGAETYLRANVPPKPGA